MNITILRGANLNEWEMQNYSPLGKYYSLKGLVAGKGNFNIQSIGFPVKKLPSPISFARKIPGGINILKMLWGDQSIYYNLTKHLAYSHIIHTAETYTTYTRQALNYKKKNPKIKVVVTVWENIPFVHEGNKKELRNKHQAISEVDHFIAMSQKAREALIIEGVDDRKITVQFMGIDLNRFLPKAKDQELISKHKIDPKAKVILTIARSVWQKGIQDIILSNRLVLNKHQNTHLVIIGDGPLHRYLVHLVNRLKITNHVTFLRNVAYNDIPKYHNLADIFILNSIPVPDWQEQFGMAIIESMACQKAVISTLSGSIPEVIGEAGVLIPPADHLALTRAILALLENDNQRMELGILAKIRVKANFNAQNVALKIKEIYESLF